MDKCCFNCKHCVYDSSVDYIGCGNDKAGEWICQESEDYFNPWYDYCESFESDGNLEFSLDEPVAI